MWLPVHPTAAHESPPIAIPDASGLPRALPHQAARVHTDAVREEGRQAVETAPEADLPERAGARVSATSSADPVRVHGQVRRGGRPVAKVDLAFRAIGAELDDDEGDWDFTDENGRYEVLLAPARYVVLNDDEGSWITNMVVSAGEDELVLDLDLPLGVE